MDDKVIRLQDLYLPVEADDPHRFHMFGIYDTENVLLSRLHSDVAEYQEDSEETQQVLQELGMRHNHILTVLQTLSARYERPVEQIESRQFLSRTLGFDGRIYQFVASDQSVKLADARIRFAQPLLWITVGEDFKTWTAIENKDGQPKELPGGLPRVLTEADQFAGHFLQMNLKFLDPLVQPSVPA